MTTAISETALADAFRQISADVDGCFDALLAVPDDPRAVLYQAMRHAAIGGGKRVRPLLLTATAAMFNVDRGLSVRVACAVEAIHVYSLIHDDMPCMDNDDMRRGKPTVHKAFNDAVAVLAGDSLHALAFEILAGPQSHPDPFIRSELIYTLAEASGPNGMAGGQMMEAMELWRKAFKVCPQLESQLDESSEWGPPQPEPEPELEQPRSASSAEELGDD